MFADEVFQLFIFRMHRNAAIAQHGFRPGRGDDDFFARRTIDDRIFDVPEMALHFLVDDFDVGNRRQQLGIPIHQPLVLVNQAVPIELHKHLAYRL